MKSKNIIMLASILLTVSACSDFLDKNPLVDTSAETYYSNGKECNDAILGIYSILQRETFQLGPFIILGDDCSDDCTLGNEKSEAYSWLGAPAQAVISFDILADNGQTSGPWTQCFRGVNFATQAIVRIGGNNDIPEASKNQFLGEAHFLRALFNFFLVRQYGRLPIIDHILTYEEYYMPRATIEETWAFIESDLKKAAELLPEQSVIKEKQPQNTGRATKGAANALLGKTYIYQGKFQEAYDILKIVENSHEYGLQPIYADIFSLEHKNGIESVFAIQHMTSNTGWADSNEGSILSFYEHDADPADEVKWHNGWSMHCPTQDLVDSYAPGDPRLAATVIFPGEFFDGRVNNNVASSTGYQPKKWYIPYAQRSQIDQSDCPKNIIFIRYADVLLYLAEAANETGKTNEALAYLEQIRGRARSNSTDPDVLPQIAETGKDALRSLIWQERRSEFACEGQRFWDLVRQGRAGQVMRAYSQKYNSGKGKFFKDGVNEIFPIPAGQVNTSNGTLEQNPGY